MSKFCPMCNQVTNCTDNCKQCIEEDRRLMEEEPNENSNNKYEEENQ